jgi:hypothetical protein
VRRRGPRAASSKEETRPRGRQALERGGGSPEGASGPSSEEKTHPRGRQALERVGDFVAWYLVLERDRDSPKGYRDRPLGGPLWLSGPWALLLWAATIRSVFFWGL